MKNIIFKIAIILFFSLFIGFSFSYSSQSTNKPADLIRRGMYEEAIELLENIIQENPENGEAHYLLGKAYLLSGEEELAFDSFDRSISAKRKDKKRLAYYFKELGRLYSLEYGELEIAEKLFGCAVEIEPKEKREIVKILLDGGEMIGKTDGYYAPKLFKLAIKYLEDQERKSAMLFDIERMNQKETIRTMNLLTDAIDRYINENGTAPQHNGFLNAFSLFYSSLVPFMQGESLFVFDCWENPFYVISGEPNKKDFLIISSGRDGILEERIPETKISFECTELSDFDNDLVIKNGNWIKIPKMEDRSI